MGWVHDISLLSSLCEGLKFWNRHSMKFHLTTVVDKLYYPLCVWHQLGYKLAMSPPPFLFQWEDIPFGLIKVLVRVPLAQIHMINRSLSDPTSMSLYDGEKTCNIFDKISASSDSKMLKSPNICYIFENEKYTNMQIHNWCHNYKVA